MAVEKSYKKLIKLLEKEVKFELRDISKATRKVLRETGINKQTLIAMRNDLQEKHSEECVPYILLEKLEKLALLKRQKLAIQKLKTELELLGIDGLGDSTVAAKELVVLEKIKQNIFISPEELVIICPNLSESAQQAYRSSSEWDLIPIPYRKRKGGKTIVYKPSEILEWCEKMHIKKVSNS